MSTPTTVQARHLASRRFIAAILSLGVFFSAGSVAVPAVASAQSNGYIDRPCIIRAMVSNGMAGDGCDLFGTPKWVDTSARGGLPKWAQDAIGHCIKAAAVGLVTEWEGDLTPETAAVIMAVHCVAEASVPDILDG
jgi:hypothetical protein